MIGVTSVGGTRTDVNGKPLNDPMPDTVLNATIGSLLSTPATGTPAPLDKFTITKPDVRSSLLTQLSAPATVTPNSSLVYSILLKNNSAYPLNGTQARLCLPEGVTYTGTSESTTVQGNEVVVTIGRLTPGAFQTVQITTTVSDRRGTVNAVASVTSSTALPVNSNWVNTLVRSSR